MGNHNKLSKEELLEEVEKLEAKHAVLEKSELKSSSWIENSPVCTKIVDLDFNLKYMSSSGVRDLKIDDITQFYGKPYPLDFYPDSFKIPMASNLKKVKETGSVITQEASVLDIEGNELWYHSTLVPVNDHRGELDYIMVVSLETSKRKQAEKAMRKSEERFQGFFDSVPAAMAVYRLEEDKHLKLILANPMLGKLIGRDSALMLGESYEETFPGKAASNIPDLFRAVARGEIETQRFIDNYKDIGLDLWFDVTVFPMGENTIGLDILDITEGELLEQKSKDALSMLSIAEEIAKMGSWSWNPNTDRVEWSDSMCRLYGIDPSGFTHTFEYASRSIHPDDVSYVNKFIETLLTGKKAQAPSEYRILTPKKEVVWIEGTNRLLFDEKGEIREVVGTVQDITGRKKAEKELLESKILLESSIESPRDMIILSLDPEYRYLFFNKTHAETMVHAYNTHPQIGECVFDFITNKDDIKSVKAYYDRALAGERFIVIEEYGEGKARFYYEIRFNPIFNENEDIIGITSFAQNITERKHAEEELSKYREQLEELVKERTKELEFKNKELERFNKLFIGREFRIKELRDQVTELEKRLNTK